MHWTWCSSASIRPSSRRREGHYFARRSNRFWPCFSRSVLSEAARARPRRHAGWNRSMIALLPAHGFGFTDLVKRPTARAGELQPDELSLGCPSLTSQAGTPQAAHRLLSRHDWLPVCTPGACLRRHPNRDLVRSHCASGRRSALSFPTRAAPTRTSRRPIRRCGTIGSLTNRGRGACHEPSFRRADTVHQHHGGDRVQPAAASDFAGPCRQAAYQRHRPVRSRARTRTWTIRRGCSAPRRWR